MNVTAMAVRLGFVLLAVPLFGIRGYLWGLLASEILLAVLDLFFLRHFAVYTWDAFDMLLKPALLLIASVGIYFFLAPVLKLFPSLPLFAETVLHIAVVCGGYCGLLLFAHLVRGGR